MTLPVTKTGHPWRSTAVDDARNHKVHPERVASVEPERDETANVSRASPVKHLYCASVDKAVA